MNFEITFRPSSENQKWKMPTISNSKRPIPQKIKRISRTKMSIDMKFSVNNEN